MPSVDDQLLISCPRSNPSGVVIHAWNDSASGQVWIATSPEAGRVDQAERFLALEIAARDRGIAGAPAHSAKDDVPGPSAPRVLLNLSAGLLRHFGGGLAIDSYSRPQLCDPVAFELVYAVVEACSQPGISEYTRRCLVTMLCAQLSGAVPATSPSRSRRRKGFDSWQRQVLEAALSDLQERDTSLDRFATRCGLSICHFARMFRESYGMPFHQYVVNLRIATACDLLSESGQSISQIALTCGFSDQASFTRSFSARTGSAPGAWRRALPAARHHARMHVPQQAGSALSVALGSH